MSLTGPLFLGSIVLLTLAAIAALVVGWRRLAGRGAGPVAARVAALVLVNALVLLTAATQLNAAFLFFADWGDLQGALTGHLAHTSLDRGGAAGQAAGRSVSGVTARIPARVPPLTLPVGSDGLVDAQVHGSLSGLTGQVLVQLPPGYDASGSRRYPVLEAFHGYPSFPANWVRIFHIGDQVERQVRAHHLRPTLTVIPQIEFPRGVDTEGVDGGANGPEVETWLTRDVPDWLAQHFRVATRRDGWATIGYSAGGFDAAMATVLHPAQFGAGIVLGGYFRPDFGPFYEPFTPDSPLGRRYDLPRVARRKAPPVSLWIETSHSDPVSYGSSARFLHAVRTPTAAHAVVLQNAGHRDSVWIEEMPQALRWLGTNVRGFHT